jgi:hypothetical protein
MGHFDIQLDAHSGHFMRRDAEGRHLSLDQLHHVPVREESKSPWRFILAMILLFALGFVVTDILFHFSPWSDAAYFGGAASSTLGGLVVRPRFSKRRAVLQADQLEAGPVKRPS